MNTNSINVDVDRDARIRLRAITLRYCKSFDMSELYY